MFKNRSQHLLIDSAEQPNANQRGRTEYGSARQVKAQRILPPEAYLAFAAIVGAVVLFGLYWAWQLLTALGAFVALLWAEYHTLILFVALACIVALCYSALYGILRLSTLFHGLAIRANLVRLPNDQPVTARQVEAQHDPYRHLSEFYRVQALRAANSQFDGLGSYSPSTHYEYRNQAETLPGDTASAPALPVVIPSFGQLVEQGVIAPGQPLLFGYDESGQPLTGSFKQLYSAGLGGLKGSGKTWTAVFLATQVAIHGGKLLVIDPHAGDDESLTTRLGGLKVIAADNTPRAIRDTLGIADEYLRARRDQGDPDRSPVLLVADEWTAMLRHTDMRKLVVPTLATITTEGRKFGVFALLMGQRWTADTADGTVRSTLTSHYVHRTRRDEALYQLGVRTNELPDDTQRLAPGTGYFMGTSGLLQRVTIPQMTTRDVAVAATTLATGQATGQATAPALLPDSGKPVGSLMVASDDVATTASGRGETPSPSAQRAGALFMGGQSPAAIVETLYGVKSNEGRKYQKALDDVLALIREGLGGD